MINRLSLLQVHFFPFWRIFFLFGWSLQIFPWLCSKFFLFIFLITFHLVCLFLEMRHLDFYPTLLVFKVNWIDNVWLFLRHLFAYCSEIDLFLLNHTFAILFNCVFIEIFLWIRLNGLFGFRQSLNLLLLSFG